MTIEQLMRFLEDVEYNHGSNKQISIQMSPGTHDYVVHQSNGVVHVVEFETTEFPPSNRQFDTWETNKPTPCVQMVIDNVIQTYGTDTDA